MNSKKKLGIILFTIIIFVLLLISIFFHIKVLLLSMAIFSLLFYFNISLTTLGNVFIGRDINPNYDIFWKILFMLIASILFGIYFNT